MRQSPCTIVISFYITGNEAFYVASSIEASFDLHLDVHPLIRSFLIQLHLSLLQLLQFLRYLSSMLKLALCFINNFLCFLLF